MIYRSYKSTSGIVIARSRAKAKAVARPIPLDAPVMITTLSLNLALSFISSLLLVYIHLYNQKNLTLTSKRYYFLQMGLKRIPSLLTQFFNNTGLSLSPERECLS